jgi:hypothetical protein
LGFCFAYLNELELLFLLARGSLVHGVVSFMQLLVGQFERAVGATGFLEKVQKKKAALAQPRGLHGGL